MQFIKLQTVLNRIPPAIRKEDYDENLLSYALDGLRFFSFNQKYINKIAIVPIHNHIVQIPEDLHSVNLVTYQADEPTDEYALDMFCFCEDTKCGTCQKAVSCGNPGIYVGSDNNVFCDTCSGCLTEKEEFESRTNSICRHNISYQLFLDSRYYNELHLPLKFIGNGSNVLCTSCPNRFVQDCSETFSIDPTISVFKTSIKDGWVCINYEAELKDNDGDFLIPKHSKLIEGLASYAEARHWQNRSAMHEQAAESRFERRLFRAEQLLRSAKGSLLLREINPNTINQITGDTAWNARILRLPIRFNRR